jgi:hypothetical protein
MSTSFTPQQTGLIYQLFLKIEEKTITHDQAYQQLCKMLSSGSTMPSKSDDCPYQQHSQEIHEQPQSTTPESLVNEPIIDNWSTDMVRIGISDSREILYLTDQDKLLKGHKFRLFVFVDSFFNDTITNFPADIEKVVLNIDNDPVLQVWFKEHTGRYVLFCGYRYLKRYLTLDEFQSDFRDISKRKCKSVYTDLQKQRFSPQPYQQYYYTIKENKFIAYSRGSDRTFQFVLPIAISDSTLLRDAILSINENVNKWIQSPTALKDILVALNPDFMISVNKQKMITCYHTSDPQQRIQITFYDVYDLREFLREWCQDIKA